MGIIDPITVVSALPAAVLPFGGAEALWTAMVGLLAVSSLGILLAARRRARISYRPRPLQVVRPVEVA